MFNKKGTFVLTFLAKAGTCFAIPFVLYYTLPFVVSQLFPFSLKKKTLSHNFAKGTLLFDNLFEVH